MLTEDNISSDLKLIEKPLYPQIYEYFDDVVEVIEHNPEAGKSKLNVDSKFLAKFINSVKKDNLLNVGSLNIMMFSELISKFRAYYVQSFNVKKELVYDQWFIAHLMELQLMIRIIKVTYNDGSSNRFYVWT